MTAFRVPVFAANWKMNKSAADVEPFFTSFNSAFGKISGCEVIVAPQSVHLGKLAPLASKLGVQTSAQNAGPAASGAFTGEVSPVAFKELGCAWTLVGHSERRHVFGEKEDLLLKRVVAATEAGLKILFCVGETLDERRAGKTISVVESQLSLLTKLPDALSAKVWGPVVIAYEPVWAIGTGENATPAQAQEVHAQIRAWIARQKGAQAAHSIRILYGGSVKADNAGELMKQPDLDGLLVGGASLEANTFAEIIKKGLTSRL